MKNINMEGLTFLKTGKSRIKKQYTLSDSSTPNQMNTKKYVDLFVRLKKF